MTIKITQGKKGRWRWHVYTGSTHRGMCTVKGFETAEEAHADAKEVFGDAVYFENPDGYLEYAGQRDVSD